MNFATDILGRARHCRSGTAYALLALGACCWTVQPLVRQALPLAHDVGFHLFQADQFAASLHGGIALPRWAADANNGYGSPNFIFYAPLTYYLVALLDLGTGSIEAAMIMGVWFSFFFSGIAMFHAAAKLCGREGALVSAVLYQMLPFHLLDLYARCTFAELFAFTWFPLIFLCAHGVFTADRKDVYAAALSASYAGLILTHLVSGYIFTAVLIAFVGFEYLSCGKIKDLGLALAATAGGLALASFYLVPVALERKFVHIDFVVRCLVGDYRQNFLFLLDHAAQGLREFRASLHLATILDLVLFLSLVGALRTGMKEKGKGVYPFFCGLFLSALFMTTPLSGPVWAAVPGLGTLQFPWRFLSLMEVSLCFVIGKVVADAGRSSGVGERHRAMVYCLMAVFLVALAIVVKSDRVVAEAYRGYPVAREYTPVTVADLDGLLAQKPAKVFAVAGTAAVQAREWLPERRLLKVVATTPAVVRVATSYYPGWVADTDGTAVPVGIEAGSGAILIGVPAGSHLVTLSFTDTRWRTHAKFVSVAALGIVLFYVCFNRKRSATRM